MQIENQVAFRKYTDTIGEVIEDSFWKFSAELRNFDIYAR